MPSAKKSSLIKAKEKKNDEFYTQLTDIEKELVHYRHHFKDAVVFCNCDDPEWSNFWKYFHLNFEFLGLKKLITTHYDPTEPTYKMEYEGGNDADITAGTITPLKTNGDFRSPECIELLKEATIICTNPPFSIAREFYIPQLIEYQKKFIIIGDLNWITYKNIFPLLRDNKMWLGYNPVKEFKQPDGTIKKFGNKLWYTNLDIDKRHEDLDLIEHYSPEKYIKYENYDAIEVNKVLNIPVDYDGVMGVPISFLDKYCPEQFEILGITSGREEFDKLAYPTKRYINAIQHNPDGSTTSGSKANTRACLPVTNPKGIYYSADNADHKLEIVYARILIRRKG